jgi:hypothetical protein
MTSVIATVGKNLKIAMEWINSAIANSGWNKDNTSQPTTKPTTIIKKAAPIKLQPF